MVIERIFKNLKTTLTNVRFRLEGRTDYYVPFEGQFVREQDLTEK